MNTLDGMNKLIFYVENIDIQNDNEN